MALSGDKVNEIRTVRGADLSSPEFHTSSFLIEAYFMNAEQEKRYGAVVRDAIERGES